MYIFRNIPSIIKFRYALIKLKPNKHFLFIYKLMIFVFPFLSYLFSENLFHQL